MYINISKVQPRYCSDKGIQNNYLEQSNLSHQTARKELKAECGPF